MKYLNIEPLLNNVLEINANNHCYDLHSDSDFTSLMYSIASKNVELVWNYPSKWFKNNSDFRNDKEYLEIHNIQSYNQRIILCFGDVALFEVTKLDENPQDTDVDTLEDIRNYHENKDGVFSEDGSITFVFQSGMKIRIHGKTFSFQIEKDSKV